MNAFVLTVMLIPEQHLASKKSRSMVEDEALQLFYDQKAQEMFGVNYDDLKDGRARQVCEVLEQEHDFFGDACRVYPNDLLPWDTEDRRKQRGRWRITVEFWPKEKE